jgi:hypothetical protein
METWMEILLAVLAVLFLIIVVFVVLPRLKLAENIPYASAVKPEDPNKSDAIPAGIPLCVTGPNATTALYVAPGGTISMRPIPSGYAKIVAAVKADSGFIWYFPDQMNAMLNAFTLFPLISQASDKKNYSITASATSVTAATPAATTPLFKITMNHAAKSFLMVGTQYLTWSGTAFSLQATEPADTFYIRAFSSN